MKENRCRFLWACAKGDITIAKEHFATTGYGWKGALNAYEGDHFELLGALLWNDRIREQITNCSFCGGEIQTLAKETEVKKALLEVIDGNN